MTYEELQQRAANNEDVPQGLDLADTVQFIGLRYLFASFKAGIISKQTGKHDKEMLERAYKTFREGKQLRL